MVLIILVKNLVLSLRLGTPSIGWNKIGCLHYQSNQKKKKKKEKEKEKISSFIARSMWDPQRVGEKKEAKTDSVRLEITYLFIKLIAFLLKLL